MKRTRIYNEVLELVQTYHTRNPFELAGDLDVALEQLPIGSLNGMYVIMHGQPVILLNTGLDPNMAKIVCAHELGHHVLHADGANGRAFEDYSISTSAFSGMEYEANLFAAQLLLDAEEMMNYLQEGYNAEEVARILGSKKDLVLIKLQELCRQGNLSLQMPELPDSCFLARADLNAPEMDGY